MLYDDLKGTLNTMLYILYSRTISTEVLKSETTVAKIS